MIRPFAELFKRIKNWPVRPVATATQQPNGGLPEHLRPAPWLPRRRSGVGGWTRLSPSETAAIAGISTRRPMPDGFQQPTSEQTNNGVTRTARFAEEGEQI
jgi:hypothetical protein